MFVTSYIPQRGWYHVLPLGAVPAEGDGMLQVVEQFKKAKAEEIPFVLAP